jgi:hypothetical protein
METTVLGRTGARGFCRLRGLRLWGPRRFGGERFGEFTTTVDVALVHETMMVGIDPRGHYEVLYGSRRLRHWAGSIERLQLEFYLRRRVWGFYFTAGEADADGDRPIELTAHDGPSKTNPLTRLELTARGWEPTFSVQVFFHRHVSLIPRPSPLVDVVSECTCPRYEYRRGVRQSRGIRADGAPRGGLRDGERLPNG